MLDLTIGMATFDDFDGLWATIQHLRMATPSNFWKSYKVELVVVDNNPHGKAGHRNQALLRQWAMPEFQEVRYVPMDQPKGTSAPRQRVFDEAKGKFVLCMDSHVLLMPHALRKLMEYIIKNPYSNDLLSGPMFYDDLYNRASHFDDVFRNGMWGTWGTDDRVFPENNPFENPFEIGAMGLGLFAARRESWAGFPPELTEFGGEEWCLHLKYRRRGDKALCIPGLGWVHRFNESVTYPRSVAAKVRNYVIWFQHLGLPLDRIYNHFVKGVNEDGSAWKNEMGVETDAAKAMNLITTAQWTVLTSMLPQVPDARALDAIPRTQSCCGGGQQATLVTLDTLFDAAVQTPSDINEHALTLRDYAQKSAVVVEFGVRHGVSTCALLAGKPKRLLSYDVMKYPEVNVFERLAAAEQNVQFEFVQGSSLDVTIPDCDLLFVDTKHTGDHLYAELTRHHKQVRNWIVLHDTVIFGKIGEDGSSGLLDGVRRFVRENWEWSVLAHYQNNNGLMVLTKRPDEKTPLPSVWRQTVNYAAAVARHAAAGLPKVSEQVYQDRLNVCALCTLLNAGRCSQCGCPVEDKALWAQETCPHPITNYWQAGDWSVLPSPTTTNEVNS